MIWKDETSYSRTELVRTPRIWAITTPNKVRITVTRHINYEPTQWLLCCPELRIDLKELKSLDEQDAMVEAVSICQDRALTVLNDIEDLMP